MQNQTYKFREQTDPCWKGGKWGDGRHGRRGEGDTDLQLQNEGVAGMKGTAWGI